MTLRTLTAEDLAHIARNGGGLEISGAGFTADQLAHIARNAAGKGSRIYISESGGFTLEQLAHIARNGGGCVVFRD